MGFKITSRGIIVIVICIVIVGGVYVGYNQFFNSKKKCVKDSINGTD